MPQPNINIRHYNHCTHFEHCSFPPTPPNAKPAAESNGKANIFWTLAKVIGAIISALATFLKLFHPGKLGQFFHIP